MNVDLSGEGIVWALLLMLMLEAFSATIPSAMLRSFPRGQASLPDRARDAPATVHAGDAQSLPESGNSPPSSPKERSSDQGKTESKVSSKPSLKPMNQDEGRPRLTVVKASLNGSGASLGRVETLPPGSVAAFLLTLPPAPGREYRFASLQQAHEAWAKREGITPLSSTRLGLALKASGFEGRKTRGVMVYRDCRHQTAKSA